MKWEFSSSFPNRGCNFLSLGSVALSLLACILVPGESWKRDFYLLLQGDKTVEFTLVWMITLFHMLLKQHIQNSTASEQKRCCSYCRKWYHLDKEGKQKKSWTWCATWCHVCFLYIKFICCQSSRSQAKVCRPTSAPLEPVSPGSTTNRVKSFSKFDGCNPLTYRPYIYRIKIL